MSGWFFEHSCNACGGDCTLLAPGTPSESRTAAVVCCVECAAEWLLTVSVSAVAGPRLARRAAVCGTDSGYYRHRRQLRDEPCAACRAAHAEATRVGKNLRSAVASV